MTILGTDKPEKYEPQFARKMKRNRILTVLAVALGLALSPSASACTSAVISGKATPNGKPLLWKHRDTGTEQNDIRHFNGPKYAFTGLVDSGDTLGRSVWAGTNSAGFSIMNTASYNLKNDTLRRLPELEGELMKAALGVCRDLKDFERFLDTLSKPRCVEANFGVIDAFGGAAYYETNNYQYFKADANDPLLAPDGYLIRTNYSFAGRQDRGMGYIRYENAVRLLQQAYERGELTPERIFDGLSRSFYHSVLGTDLRREAPAGDFVVDQDYIPRHSSSASIVVEGVKAGGDPAATTMWCVLGYPPCSLAFPVWVAAGDDLPFALKADRPGGHAPACDLAVGLKRKAFPIERGNGSKYLDFHFLYNPEGTGLMQAVVPREAAVFKAGRAMTGLIEANGFQARYARDFNRAMDDLFRAYRDEVSVRFDL